VLKCEVPENSTIDASLVKKEIFKVVEPWVRISGGSTERMYRVEQVGSEMTETYHEDSLEKTDPPYPLPEMKIEDDDLAEMDPSLPLPTEDAQEKKYCLDDVIKNVKKNILDSAV